MKPEALPWRAEKILRKNDIGGWTKAAPNLYPHQWSWDSAFIALGLAHLDTRRAARELQTLFAHQWKTGKVPHIVFNSDAPPHSYFPGSEHWACAAASPDAPPAPPYTSCLSQPPVHAIAALRIWEAAKRRSEEEIASAWAFLKDIYPKLLSWHRYLLTYRDPEGSGLVTIYHPWGSGTDNSPRWDAALAAVEVSDLPPYPRYDLQHVGSPSQKPTDADYDRYLWLVELIKRAWCDETTIYESHPFLVKDVLSSAILVAANEALLKIAELVEAQEEDHTIIAAWIVRGRRGLEGCWDPELGLCLDYDLRADRPLQVRTVAGFAPLIAGSLDPGQLGVLLKTSIRRRSWATEGCAGLYRRAPAPRIQGSTPAATGGDRPGRLSTGSCGGRSSGPTRLNGPGGCDGQPWSSSPRAGSGSTLIPSPASSLALPTSHGPRPSALDWLSSESLPEVKAAL